MPNEEERKPHKHHNHHNHNNNNNNQPSMVHVHTYLTEADVADEHQHVIMGVSGPARENAVSHVHRVHGRTSFLAEEDGEGHWHMYDVMTGPAVELPDGNHIHYFAGTTSEDDDHCHSFAGATGLGPTEEEEDDDDDDCEEVEAIEEEEDECEMPLKSMPKYKKYGKRPEEE